jgi:uncharacterized protein YegP (UPF0339 family)
MTSHKATIYKGEDGDWHWRVQAHNGEIVSEGEGYEERAGAVTGLGTAHPEFAGEDFTDVESATVTVE